MTLALGEREAKKRNVRGQTPLYRRRWLRRTVVAVVGLVGLAILYVAITFLQVWWASRQDHAQPAQAIIVMGAAQYDGRPSPVLAARLDHAAALYKRKLAPMIVVTGGSQPGDLHTEAEASANYLMAHGVPGTAIERETSSTNSWESLAAAARFLRVDGITDVILVSDPYHSFRIAAIARDLGLEPHASPTRSSPTRGFGELRALARETVAVSLGRVLGYDRVVRIDNKVHGHS